MTHLVTIIHSGTSPADRKNCLCFAGTMSKLATREEMAAVVKGTMPPTVREKVDAARAACIEALQK